MQTQFKIQVNPSLLPNMLGSNDANLRRLTAVIRSRLSVRGDVVTVEGPSEEETTIRQVFRDLSEMARKGPVDDTGLKAILALAGFSTNGTAADEEGGVLILESTRSNIRTRSRNQEEYVRAAMKSDLVFAVGPAGTGKTYLAVAIAVRAFLEREVDRIILVRPAVEAGERLGFLPGDLKEKVDPYFRPIYDALMEMIPANRLKRLVDENRIEIAPLAYMRGRTLSNAFVILDEAQNTTGDQLKMFLTRLGMGTKAIVTGDLTQIDLVEKEASGLKEALYILRNIRGVGFVTLDSRDVVRHALVRDIIHAYDSVSQHKDESGTT